MTTANLLTQIGPYIHRCKYSLPDLAAPRHTPRFSTSGYVAGVLVSPNNTQGFVLAVSTLLLIMELIGHMARRAGAYGSVAPSYGTLGSHGL